MSHQEPTGYENEPVEHFIPLPPDLYCTFFDLEMGKKRDDCSYYSQLLKKFRSKTVLELGCGTGRIVEFLNGKGYRTFGIDNSHAMLRYNHTQRLSPVAEMDMSHLGFGDAFDAVIIPHNTLNLLDDEKTIRCCLKDIKRVLTSSGPVIFQIFSETRALADNAHKRLFQFALFDTQDNGKLVKETIKTYHPESNTLLLEERYKIRSFNQPSLNMNYNQLLSLTVYSSSRWLDIIQSSGFKITSLHSGYNSEAFHSGYDSSMLITAHLSK